MPDFNVRSDSVNVEQIMEQIRARIREKRGVDYTEQQIRDLAAVKLEKFLDPKGVRSDLLEQFRKVQPAYEPPELPNYEFEESTLYETHRGPLRFIRKLLNPLLKLLFNPNKLIQALHIQSKLNTMFAEREARREAARRATDQLTYELIHNLVVETTRLGIEVKNLKMRLQIGRGGRRRAGAIASAGAAAGRGSAAAAITVPGTPITDITAITDVTAVAIRRWRRLTVTGRSRSAKPAPSPPSWPSRWRTRGGHHGRSRRGAAGRRARIIWSRWSARRGRRSRRCG
ncbi:MAG: hypothetical protein AUF76_08900 [Acidobacteria bacterium 13_1_20CM_2_65_9]|nr:MAG: hypothetical protein AUF76_08900 [Acidobacteria bacterium 13_1_20CM_2_65_9]